MAAPEMPRTEPPTLGDERLMLDAWLDYYRGHAAAQVRHLTEMERAYPHRLADPQVPLRYCTEDSPDGDFEDATPEQVTPDLQSFAEHCARSRRVTAGLSLDDTFGRTQPYTLRWR